MTVLEELQQVREKKNADYGNAFEKVGVLKRVMADEDGPTIVELHGDGTYDVKGDRDIWRDHTGGAEAVVLADTPEKTSTFEENVDGVLTRLLDKVIRTYTLVFLKDEPAVENESTEDAAKDLTGYGSMLADLIRGTA